MDLNRIAALLQPFIAPPGSNSTRGGSSASGVTASGSPLLPDSILQAISIYIDILLRWNARLNLTAIRSEEEMVTRHFGESLFAARHLFPAVTVPDAANPPATNIHHLLDLGSGAGFPGIPIKLWAPAVHLTLVESNQKKASFLREVSRVLTLTNINVVASRAEGLPAGQSHTVTLRAVERFDQVLPIAARLLQPSGRLALLIGSSQAEVARKTLPAALWSPMLPIPLSQNRILLIGQLSESKE